MLFLLAAQWPAAQTVKSYKENAVLFGEQDRLLPAADSNVIRIFVDQHGFFYPANHHIPDAELRKNDNSLSAWYINHPKLLDSLSLQHELEPIADKRAQAENLNNAIIRQIVKKINQQLNNYAEVDVLIHGFRKKAYGKTDKFSTYSWIDNQLIREGIKQRTKGKNIFFLEIYWDSKYISPAKAYKLNGFELFEQASIPAADKVGLSLRKLIPQLNCSQINIVAHSLGARLCGELLFNASSIPGEEGLPVPPQADIRIALMAPAIGANFFLHYYSRNRPSPAEAKDNYKLCIAYNRHDFVLLKNYASIIQLSPYAYGDTSLGCDYLGSLDSLKNKFVKEFIHSTMPLTIDFSLNQLGKPLYCHLIKCYTEHSGFNNLIDFLHPKEEEKKEEKLTK